MFVESKQALAGLLAKLVEFLTHQFPLPVIGLEYHIHFFFLGVNHLYLLLWFIAIVAFSVLTTIVHCLCITDRPEGSAC